MSIAFTVCWFLGLLHAQNPTVTLKVRESGFLKSERSMTVELSTQGRDKALTSDNVNAGEFYYFLLTPVGDWQIEPDFVAESLPSLTALQDSQRIAIAWKGDIVTQKEATSVLIGFPKTLLLHKPFMLQFKLPAAVSQGTITAAMELWPAYTPYTQLTRQAEGLAAERKYHEAAAVYESIIGNQAFLIYPDFESMVGRRTQVFESLFGMRTGGFADILGNASMPLKQKIAEVEGLKPDIQFVIDSLPKPDLRIMPSDPPIRSLITRAKYVMVQLGTSRDSLQRLLDDQNTRWIIEGSATGRLGMQYKTMIQILASAFSSLNFSDTAATVLTPKLSEDDLALLSKNNLTESYETFMRLTQNRFENKLSLLPVTFLVNLERDTASFSLPYHAMLKAVNDYYARNFEEAKRNIFKVFATCYDPALSERYDGMRVVIKMREEGFPVESVKLLKEAEELEANGQPEQAFEKYRQASTIAPNFAHAAYSLGRYYARTGDPYRAATFLERAYVIDTLYLSAYRETVNLHRRGGNFKVMREVLTVALQYGNDYWETNFNLGTACMGDGDAGRAIEYFEKARTWNSKSYETYIQLGLAYLAIKDYSKARDYFNRAINLDPARQEAVDYLKRLNEQQRNQR